MFPLRSVNENKALRQGFSQPHVFAAAPARPHSPTRVSIDGHPLVAKPLIVVPKPSAANPQKPKVLPALGPRQPSGADDPAESDVPEVKPRPNLRERVPRIPDPTRRHSVELITEGSDFPEISDEAVSDDAITTPAPILQLAKRSVRKPLPP
jgi:hypothetical protein